MDDNDKQRVAALKAQIDSLRSRAKKVFQPADDLAAPKIQNQEIRVEKKETPPPSIEELKVQAQDALRAQFRKKS